MASHEQISLDAALFDQLEVKDSPEGPGSSTETGPNGSEYCDGPDGEVLPCFACYDPDGFEEGA